MGEEEHLKTTEESTEMHNSTEEHTEHQETEHKTEETEHKVEEKPQEEKPKHSNESENGLEKTKVFPKKERKPFKQRIKDIYIDDYKKLLIIPFTILILALILTSIQIATTGDFVDKDVSLKGGITITINSDDQLNLEEVENFLKNKFPDADIAARSLKQVGKQVGIVIDGSENLDAEEVIQELSKEIGEIKEEDYSVAAMGSSLGSTFFKETLKAIYISFLFMGIVIFWYFGDGTKTKLITSLLTVIAATLMFAGTSSIIKDILAYIIGITLIVTYIKNSTPSFMVILNVFSDILVTLAIVNLFNIKLSTAGIAAFLMIIGYSVDTNILLSTKLLKRKEGSTTERLFSAMKTGMTMSFTTLAAVTIALIFSQSATIKQIMVILLIGLLVDMLYTWIQNAGILRYYLEKKKYKNEF
jgi:preprotein translocase subunit SecF